jgi:hypothetical protein
MKQMTLSEALRRTLARKDPVTGKTTAQIMLEKLEKEAAKPTEIGRQSARLLARARRLVASDCRLQDHEG